MIHLKFGQEHGNHFLSSATRMTTSKLLYVKHVIVDYGAIAEEREAGLLQRLKNLAE
jgi:hypothetical protein